jgi:V/A-type H+-transporting ATPase subunit C
MPAATRIRDDLRYGFAVGRVRVLQGRLLTPGAFERLLDAPDLREQKRILAETHLGRYLESATTATEVERGLAASLADLYDEFLEKAELPSALVTYFLLPHDFIDLRAVLKARRYGVPIEGPVSGLGVLDPETMSEPAQLPEPFGTIARRIEGAEEPLTSDEITAEIDRELFAELAKAAKASKVPFLRELTTLRIDIANVRLLLRARQRGLAAADIAGRLIPGGTPSLERIAQVAPRMSGDELATAILNTGALGYVIEEDLLDLERFDLVADTLVAGRMLAARRAPSGAEPVLAYVMAREAEVLLVRTVVLGHLSGLDRELVRARVKERG